MHSDLELFGLAILGLVIVGGWTAWSANKGRRIARWGRRRLRRLALAVVVLVGVFLFLSARL